MKKVIVLLSLVFIVSSLLFAGGTKEHPEEVNDGRESVVIVGAVDALSEKIKDVVSETTPEDNTESVDRLIDALDRASTTLESTKDSTPVVENKTPDKITVVLDPSLLPVSEGEPEYVEELRTILDSLNEKDAELTSTIKDLMAKSDVSEPEYISTLKEMVTEVKNKNDELSSLIIKLSEPKEEPVEKEHILSGVGYSMDDQSHWKICALCGEKMNDGSHTFGKAQGGDSQGHFRSCTVCSYNTKEAHNWDKKYITNSKTHIRKCSDCGYLDEGEHQYKLVGTGGNEVETCMVCGYENKKVKKAHNSFMQLGLCGRFNEDLTQVSLNPNVLTYISSYAFGISARFNVSALGIQSEFMFTPGSTSLQAPMFVESSATIALRGKFGFFELYGGVGGRFKIQIGEDPNNPAVSSNLYLNALDAVKDIFFVKLGLGIDSGIFGVLIDYRLPLGTFFEINQGVGVLASGPISLTAVLNLF